MKIQEDWLTQFAFDHQSVPRIEAISAVDKYQKKGTGPDYPDEWFIKLTTNGDLWYPHLGAGFYALSQIGFEANLGLLEQKYNEGAAKSTHRNGWRFMKGTWLQYQGHMDGYFYARLLKQIENDVVAYRDALMHAEHLHVTHIMKGSSLGNNQVAFLQAQRGSVLDMLSQSSPNVDPIGHFQWKERLLEIEEQLRNLGVTDFT